MARPRADQPATDLSSSERAPANGSVLVVAAGSPSWAEVIGRRSVAPAALTANDDSAHDALAGAECVVVDADSADPLVIARRVHALDPTVQVIAVVQAEQRRQLERAILFAPGIGELWLASPADVAGALTDRAIGVTRQRRKFERVRARVEAEHVTESPQRTERALVSDAYLARLLEVLPDAVFSVDASGRILSANPGASALLGRDARELIGRPLAEIVSSQSGDVVKQLVGSGVEQVAHAEVHFPRAEATPGVAELTVIPVVAGATRVWAAVLHDVTEREQARVQLQQQATELEQQVEEAQVMAEELQQTDEERRRALETAEEARAEAEAARIQAEEASRSKSEFLSTMSHEIRTPINAIVGYAQLMEMGISGPLTQEQRTHLERIATSGQHLLALINDILDLAKVESGRLVVTTTHSDASAAADAALDLLRPQAAAKDVSLSRVCDSAQDATYVGDTQRVQQILVNLLSNAVKFTPAGGSVTVRCGVAERADEASELHGGPWTFIEVEDTGIGIEPQVMARLFEPFYQGETGYTRTHGGTGLGLSISRRLARLMGGDLTMQSRAGEGSRFTVWLPKGTSR